MSAKAARLTTKELSRRTFPDFERFFARVHGCCCTLPIFGRHLGVVAGTAKERGALLGAPDRSRKYFPHRDWLRARQLAAMWELVRTKRTHGILVYSDGEPVGWCQFGRRSELPLTHDKSVPPGRLARYASTDWRITCFTTRVEFRGRGVATTALAAALDAIRTYGGGWVEATPIAFPHNDPTLRQLRRRYGWRSSEVADYVAAHWPATEVPGIGRLRACPATGKTMSSTGTMSMFAKFGFTPTRRDEHFSSDDPTHPGDFVVMRRKV